MQTLLLNGAQATEVASKRPIVAAGCLRLPDGTPIRANGQMQVLATAPVATNPTSWDTMRTRGYSTARIGVKTFQIDRTPAQQVGMVDQVVDLAQSKGHYVMLMNSVQPGAYDDSVANMDSVDAFWELFAPRYANRPHVFYELTNEPTSGSVWGHANQWINPTTDAPLPVTTRTRQLFDAVRADAPNTPIVVFSTANIAPSVARWRRVVEVFESLGPAVDWTKTVVGYHHYDGTMSLDGPMLPTRGMNSLAVFRGFYPTLMTETNYWMSTNLQNDTYRLVYDAYEAAGQSWTILGGPADSHNAETANRLGFGPWFGSSV